MGRGRGRGWGRVSLAWLVTYLVDIGMRLGGQVPCLRKIGMCLGERREQLRGRGPRRMGIRLGGRVPYLDLVNSACLPGGATGEDRKGESGDKWIEALCVCVGVCMWAQFWHMELCHA